jgi:hypothetical protein
VLHAQDVQRLPQQRGSADARNTCAHHAAASPALSPSPWWPRGRFLLLWVSSYAAASGLSSAECMNRSRSFSCYDRGTVRSSTFPDQGTGHIETQSSRGTTMPVSEATHALLQAKHARLCLRIADLKRQTVSRTPLILAAAATTACPLAASEHIAPCARGALQRDTGERLLVEAGYASHHTNRRGAAAPLLRARGAGPCSN